MATANTSSEMMPMAWDGKKRWKGKKNPVTLVATVVQIKTAVQPLSGLEARSPNITTNPAKIPIKLNKTCTKVNMVIPKIMIAPFEFRRGRPGGRLTYTRPPRRANALRRPGHVSSDRFVRLRNLDRRPLEYPEIGR